MGLFILEEQDASIENLVYSAKANIELYLREGGDYLLNTFALSQLDKALEKLSMEKE